MGLIQKPFISKNDEGFALSFTYGFSSDPINTYNISGAPFSGSQFSLNVQSIQGAANLPPFRSLRMSIFFQRLLGEEFFDGGLVVSTPYDGSVLCMGMKLPPSVYIQNPAISAPTPSLNCAVPLHVPNNAVVNFTKMTDGGAGVSNPIVSGLLFATLYSYKVQPYSIAGNGYVSTTFDD